VTVNAGRRGAFGGWARTRDLKDDIWFPIMEMPESEDGSRRPMEPPELCGSNSCVDAHSAADLSMSVVARHRHTGSAGSLKARGTSFARAQRPQQREAAPLGTWGCRTAWELHLFRDDMGRSPVTV
jgi:hypothetical protein